MVSFVLMAISKIDKTFLAWEARITAKELFQIIENRLF